MAQFQPYFIFEAILMALNFSLFYSLLVLQFQKTYPIPDHPDPLKFEFKLESIVSTLNEKFFSFYKYDYIYGA